MSLISRASACLSSLGSSLSCATQVSLQTAKSLKDDHAVEQCRDLRAVLNLLIHITQSDLSAEEEDSLRPPDGVAMVAPLTGPGDTAAPATVEGTSVIARVVLVGLNIVLPLINAELLKFPKLAQLYYSLLSYMLEVYPRAVAELAPDQFGSLMATLEWGVLGSDVVAVHCSLEGLTGLARYHYQSVQTAGRGLNGQSAGKHIACVAFDAGSYQPTHVKYSLLWRC